MGETGPALVRVYRPELQGLRAVAALLVVAYHVWFGRVSGGVDVFFLISGFLLTGQLLTVNHPNDAGGGDKFDFGTERVRCLDQVHRAVGGAAVPVVAGNIGARGVEEVPVLDNRVDMLPVELEHGVGPGLG